MDEFNVDELFPYWKDGKASYRKGQKESIVKAIDALVEQDYDVFFLDCPVGFGKSAALVTIARVFAELGLDSYVTTPQKILQDQYYNEFKDIPQIKGRRNYVCADDNEVSCAEGECQLDEKYHSGECDSCVYVNQRDKCRDSVICGMNTSYLMTVRKEVFGERGLFIADEGHSLPEWGIGFVSLVIREDIVGMIPDFKEGFAAYILWLERMVHPRLKEEETRMKERLKGFGKGRKKAVIGLIEAYKKTKDTIKKIEILSEDYAVNKEDWIYNIETDARGRKIVFMPLTSGRFLDNVLWGRGEKMIISSGTVTPEVFVREGGLDRKAFDIDDCVMTVESEFPVDKSPIYYKAVGKMTSDKKALSFPLIVKEINKVILERNDRKGIIHSFSYDNAKYIVDNISPELRGLIWVQDRDDRSGSLEKWMSYEKPSVFVSTNMTEGLNLADELCRYQIYVKIGFPNTQDKRVAKRLELGHWLWYYMQAIEDLEQSSGRATRSKEDWSEMFIYDASFATVFTKYNKYLKKWFKDRMRFISNY